MMPSASRTVARSVTMLTRHGYSRRRALGIVVSVAERARQRVMTDRTGATSWLDEIEQVARARLGGCRVTGKQNPRGSQRDDRKH